MPIIYRYSHFNKKFSPKIENFEEGLFENKSINYLLGVDWYPGNEWSITSQFCDEYILDHSKEIEMSEHTFISTIGISKKVLYIHL